MFSNDSLRPIRTKVAALAAGLALATAVRAQDCDPHMMLHFDGVDDYATITGQDTLPLEKFSIGAWIRTTSYGTERRGIVGRGEDPVADHIPWALELWTDGTITVEIEDASDNNLFYGGTTFVADGLWHHVAATLDGSNELVLYVDGQVEAKYSGALVPIDGTGDAHIGNLSLQHPPQQYGHFGGDIDEVFMVAEAVGADVIGTIYDGGVDPTLDNLACFMKLDEWSGDKLADSSGNSHSGYLGSVAGSNDVNDPQREVSQAPVCKKDLPLNFNFELNTLHANDKFKSVAWGGKPFAPQLLVVIAVNGAPTFVPVLFDYFDANGEYDLGSVVPTGTPAVDVTLITFGIVPSGHVKASNAEDVSIQ